MVLACGLRAQSLQPITNAFNGDGCKNGIEQQKEIQRLAIRDHCQREYQLEEWCDAPYAGFGSS